MAVGCTAEASYSIWELAEWEKEYVVLQFDWREVKTGKGDIMLMVGDVRGDLDIEFFHSISCYVFTMKNCEKLREGSHEGVYWMFL